MTIHLEPKELIRAGRLSEARKHLTEAVKSAPADLGLRTLLFQVLAFCGEWDKAEKQLKVVAEQDPSKETGVQVYLNLVQAERARLEVARLKMRPAFLPQAPPYVERYFAAWDKVLEKRFEEAGDLLEPILVQEQPLTGTLEGRDFRGFRDTDSFLSRFFELFVQSQYVWVPFGALREIVISAPKTLFDLIWLPVRIITMEGLSVPGYTPVVYPNSFGHEDERVRMGRMTAWEPLDGDFSRASGQHVFEVGGEEVAILDMREVRFGESPPLGES